MPYITKAIGVYGSMPLNEGAAKQLKTWMDEQGIPNQVPIDKLHTTVIHSTVSFGPYQPLDAMQIVKPRFCDEYAVYWGDPYNFYFRLLGEDKRSLALCFVPTEAMAAQFWNAISAGADWDFMKHDKIWHVTLSYGVGPDFDFKAIKAMPDFDLVFDPEVVEDLNKKWPEDNGLRKDKNAMRITKVDDDQHMVWGWASVATEKGLLVQDYQGDFILTEDLQKAAHGFMQNSRRGDQMHTIKNIGTIVESIVFTNDLQKALGIDLGVEGWFIGVKVEDQKTWDAVKSGTFQCFSIGGQATKEPVYDDQNN